MAYDPRLRQTVLFGGTVARYRGIENLYDTWTYNGKTWSKQSPSTSPSVLGVIAYDAKINSLVLFGSNDTWMYRPVQP